jgi:DNA-binding beta-propeller fold protein YncE
LSTWTSVRTAAVGLAFIAGWGGATHAQIAVSANDAKVTLVDGVQTIVRNPAADTVTIIDLSTSPPRIVATLAVPTSVVGPPQSVAIAPDRSIALVTAAQKIDPADPSKTIPDDRVTVIDLRSTPPAVLATLHAGSAPSGVSINRAGTLALVANRSEGTVSVFTIRGKTVAAAGKVDLGAPESGPSHVVFTPDGATALVSRNNDSLISVLRISGSTVENTKRDIASGLKPYGIDLTPTGTVAIVANIGAGPSGGSDTLSVIDLTATPPRAVDQVAVGSIPEGLAVSPDGAHVAVTVMNGSNLPKSSPFFNDFGRLRIFALNNRTLTPVAEAKIGHWCQGAAWTGADTLLVQCMVEQEIQLFRFLGHRLVAAGSLKMPGAPAGIRAVAR